MQPLGVPTTKHFVHFNRCCLKSERTLQHPRIMNRFAASANQDIAFLESWIDSVDTQNNKLHAFVLPGGCQQAASLHLARTVCRRAERSVLTLHQQEGCSRQILMLLNRLSDLLFALARLANKETGTEDIPWIPNEKDSS